METSDLNRSGFWNEENQHLTVLGNPRRNQNLRAVSEQANAFPEIGGNILVETSGSSGRPRFVCLSRKAMMASARAVNTHLGVGGGDRWLCALPTFHVGGLAIYARGQAAGIEVVEFEKGWDVAAFCDAVAGSRATLTAMVPTQVADLVASAQRAPQSLRAVVVGGGHLTDALEVRARELGWRLLRSYGMTETASQIATQSLDQIEVSGCEFLPILSHCGVRAGADERLEISGESVCEYYLDGDVESGFELALARDADGWLKTNDRGEVTKGCLHFLGRSDRLVKILGELVDVDDIEGRFRECFPSVPADTVFVEAFADERRGFRLVPLVLKGCVDAAQIRASIEEQNCASLAIEQIEAAMWVDEIPHSALGKVRRGELRRLARLR